MQFHSPPRPRLPSATALVLGMLALAACAPDASPVDPAAPSLAAERLPERTGPPAPGTVVPNRYVVVLHDESRDALDRIKDMIVKYDGELHYVYRHALTGFAATLPPAALAELERYRGVRLIEPDRVVVADQQTTQGDATWGLDRIDQVHRPMDDRYHYFRTGAGVTAYVLDTGIQTAHAEFGGRAHVGYDAWNGSGQDCNGHGTHVAGTLGGRTWGVAKQVTLISVRVLDCNSTPYNPPAGTTSTFVAGVDWITAHHTTGPAVANMSLHSYDGYIADIAVNAMIQDGVVAVASAGNVGIDACKVTPARVPDAITVSATRDNDEKWSLANFGSCVDMFAPGHQIRSAELNGTSTRRSGSSMATAHVSGAAALVLERDPKATPAAVAGALYAWATHKQLTQIGPGSPNRLLNVSRMFARVGYQAHVMNRGWLGDVYDYGLAGTVGESRRMEALSVELVHAPAGVGVGYQAHLQGTGWQSPRYNGSVAGTTGEGRRMEAVKIWLTGAQPGMGICYRAHVKGLGWMSEVCDGKVAGTTGDKRRMEAIQIRVYGW
jgi:hypothetical protein